MEEERKPNQIRWFLRAFPLTFCAFTLLYVLALLNKITSYEIIAFITLGLATLWALIVGFTQLRESLTRLLSVLLGHFFWAALGLCTAPFVAVIWEIVRNNVTGIDDPPIEQRLGGALWVTIAWSFPLTLWLFMGFLAGVVVVWLYRFFSSGFKSSKRA